GAVPEALCPWSNFPAGAAPVDGLRAERVLSPRPDAVRLAGAARPQIRAGELREQGWHAPRRLVYSSAGLCRSEARERHRGPLPRQCPEHVGALAVRRLAAAARIQLVRVRLPRLRRVARQPG